MGAHQLTHQCAPPLGVLRVEHELQLVTPASACEGELEAVAKERRVVRVATVRLGLPDAHVGGDIRASGMIDGHHGEDVDMLGLTRFVGYPELQESQVGARDKQIVEIYPCERRRVRTAEGAGAEMPRQAVPAVDQRAA